MPKKIDLTNSKRDFFLSYHSKDKETARSFAEQLKIYGFSVWFDQWDLILGDNFSQKIENALTSASAIAVLVGPSGIGPWEELEIRGALIQSVQIGKRVIPVLLPDANMEPELPLFLKCFTYLDLRKGFDLSVPDRLRLSISNLSTTSQILNINSNVQSLSEILVQARKRIIISGHTLNKFVNDISLRSVLLSAITNEVRILIIQLNPNCNYARAHQPYHELESTSSMSHQNKQTLEFFSSTFEYLNEAQKELVEVVFVNYMPRFRAIIVDETVYLYLYMFGVDVSSTPDIILEPTNTPERDILRQRILYSTIRLGSAPEAIPFIRSGTLKQNWSESKIASWDFWTSEERKHHQLTYDFYVTYAQTFDNRFGHLLEREVIAHLDCLSGKTLVLGCGSGKEVEYITKNRPRDLVYGIDFSHVAIELAKSKHKKLHNLFHLCDLYDLGIDDLGNFDSIIANAALVHLYKRDDIDEILRKIREKLTPGGKVFIRTLYKEMNGVAINQEIDDSPEHHELWRAPRWFVYYSREELIERCQLSGFNVLENITEKIARKEYNSSGKHLENIRKKGFPHSQYREVYWPTLLIQKKD